MRFIVIITSVFLSVSAYASTLDQQASDLRAKCLRNFEGVKTAGFTVSISASAPLKGASVKSASSDKVTWDRGAKKLKWKRGGGPGQAWVADATANTLKHVSVGASVIEESLDEQHALEMSTPSPRWLWHPEWLIPEKPVSVRDEGSALVLVASATHPKREIWLDKTTDEKCPSGSANEKKRQDARNTVISRMRKALDDPKVPDAVKRIYADIAKKMGVTP